MGSFGSLRSTQTTEDFEVFKAALAVTVAVVWAVWQWRRVRPRAMKLFARDLIEHPDEYDELEEEYQRFSKVWDEAKAAPPPTVAEFPQLIDDLLSNDRFRFAPAEIRLAKVAAEAEQLLLATLSDSRASWTRDDSDRSAPAERVAKLLAAIPSRTLGERIGHLTDHPANHVHRLAIKAKTALGRAADLPFVLGKLVEQSEYAQEGVEVAIAKGWAEPAYIAAIHEWAEQATLDDSRPLSVWAIKFFAKNGGPTALEKLQSPRVLSPANERNVHIVLSQLNLHDVKLPAEVVKPLLDKALSNLADWPWSYVFEGALIALALSDRGTADKLAEEHLDNRESPCHRAAIAYYYKSVGLPHPYAVEPPPGMAVTDEERSLLNNLAECSNLYGEVCNGGISQYFFNTTSNWWPQHVAALRAIGFEQGAAAIEQAARIIDPKGASLDRGERVAQYAALSDRKEKQLDKLSELFYSDAPRIRYMLRHRELFIRVREARRDAGLDAD